jgi:hypothetical protein
MAGKLNEGGFTHIEGAVSFDRWDFERAFEFGLSTILQGSSGTK